MEDASHASTLNTLVPTTPLAASAAALYTPQPMSAGGTTSTDARVARLQELESEALQYKTEAQRCRTLSVSLSRQLAHFKLEEADWRAKEADAERRAALLLTDMVDQSPNLLSVYQHNGYSANAAPLAAVVPSSAAKRRADQALLMPPPPPPPPTAPVSAAARMAAVAPKIAPALAPRAPVAPVATEAPVTTPPVAPAYGASSAFAWSPDDHDDDPAEAAAPTTPTAEPVTVQPQSVPSAEISVAASTTIVAPAKTWSPHAAAPHVEPDATAAHTDPTATAPGERVAHCRPMHALGMATAKARVHSLQLLANELFTADHRGCLRFWELPAGGQAGRCRAMLRGPKDTAAARLSHGSIYTATLAGAAMRLDLEGRKDMELRCAVPLLAVIPSSRAASASLNHVPPLDGG